MGSRSWCRAARRIGAGLAVAAYVVVSGPPAVAAPTCEGRPATIVGTSAADDLRGTSHADVIVARGGADTIRSFGGADVICGGPGDDTVSAGSGPDVVRGEAGQDTLDPGGGDDDVDGGDAVDTLRLRAVGSSTIDLPAGTATGAGDDAVTSLEIVTGSGSDFTVTTATDTVAVVLTGDHADRVITSDAGDAVVGPPLTLSLGPGNDGYVIRQPGVLVVEDLPGGSGGRDQFDIETPGTTVIHDGADGLRLTAPGEGSEIITVTAVGSSTYLDTGGGDDVVAVRAEGGSVTFDAGAGNDRISGSLPGFADIRLGEGDDVVESLWTRSSQPVDAGPGTDTLIGSPGRDVVDLATGLWRWGGHTVPITGVDRVGGGGGPDLLRGDARANPLLGGPGDDLLRGRGGDDVLTGGPGADVAIGGPGHDRCLAETRQGC